MKKYGILLVTACLVISTLMGCMSEEVQLQNKAVLVTLEGNSAVCDGAGVTINGGQITITSHGIYRFTGTLTDGQIQVDCGDSGEVWLILDNMSITSSDGPCIHIQQADMTHIYLEEGTVNTLTDSVTYTLSEGEDEPDAAIFSRDDMVLQGTGTLQVTANHKTAIAGKDALTITDGVYKISSVGHGIKGKDSLTITGGRISVMADGDGLKATNIEEEDTGIIRITGGVVNVQAGDEGMQAESDIVMTGGIVTINSQNNGIRSLTMRLNGGELSINAKDTPLEVPDMQKADDVLLLISGVAQ